MLMFFSGGGGGGGGGHISPHDILMKSIDELVLFHFVVRHQWGLCSFIIVDTILPPSPVILWIVLACKPKWLPLNFGYHDVMLTAPIAQ